MFGYYDFAQRGLGSQMCHMSTYRIEEVTMQSRYSLLCVLAIVISVLLVTTDAKAQPIQCSTPGGITVTAQPKFQDTTNTVWDFFLDGPSQTLNSVKDFVLVIHRPVTPNDIVSPLAVRTYCEQSDTNTRINRGNCDGFPLISIPLTKVSGTRLKATVKTSSTVTEGLVTPSVITGASNSEACSATVDNVPTGIVGPGEKGDPFQPVFKDQVATVAGGKCSVKLIFDSSGQLADVQLLNAAEGCTRTVGPILIEGSELKNNTSPHGITWGNGTCTTYGPPIPSPSRTICK